MLAVIKCLIPSVRSIDELIKDDDVSRMNVLTKGATGCCGNDVGATLLPEGIDVGPVVDQTWHMLVHPTVSGVLQKNKESKSSIILL